jgi:hypothetical protein
MSYEAEQQEFLTPDQQPHQGVTPDEVAHVVSADLALQEQLALPTPEPTPAWRRSGQRILAGLAGVAAFSPIVAPATAVGASPRAMADAALTNEATLWCQQTAVGSHGHEEGFVHSEIDKYKLGSRVVKVGLELNPMGPYSGNKLLYDCSRVANTSVTVQVARLTIDGKGHKKYVPVGKPSKPLTFVTSESNHPKKPKLRTVNVSLPDELSGADVDSKKYAIRTTIVSKAKKNIPSSALEDCQLVPISCKDYPEKLPDLSRQRDTPVTYAYARQTTNFAEASSTITGSK